MDPNITLKELREITVSVNNGTYNQSHADCIITLEQLAEKFKALDEWLTRNGFLPSDWSKSYQRKHNLFNQKKETPLKETRDIYYKDFGDGASYMSGLAIPKDVDGVCRGYHFIKCDFHAGCTVPYENCKFTNCNGTPNYKQKS